MPAPQTAEQGRMGDDAMLFFLSFVVVAPAGAGDGSDDDSSGGKQGLVADLLR